MYLFLFISLPPHFSVSPTHSHYLLVLASRISPFWDKIAPGLPQMGRMWDYPDQMSVHFWLIDVKLSENLWGKVQFVWNLAQFCPKSVILKLRYLVRLFHLTTGRAADNPTPPPSLLLLLLLVVILYLSNYNSCSLLELCLIYILKNIYILYKIYL